MPTLTVRKDIRFHYTDSGPIHHNNYSTLVFVHGFAFHTGTFQKLLPVASSHSLRVICVSRREYEGSSPYSDEELRVINRGSHDERAKFLQEQGILLALFVDGIIQTLSLPKAGGVTVIGWSLGNAFTLALRACIGDLPVDTRGRLKSYARSFVLWDPPQQVLGFTPNDPWPSADEFRAIFVKGVSAHYKHIDLDSKDPSLLDRVGDPSIKPTSDTMTPDELSSMLDFTPCFRSELPVLLPIFSSPLFDQMTKALVDPQVREDWGGIPVWHVTGDRNPWGIITSPWVLEDKIGSKKLKINVKWIKDANHFLMWEEPDRCLTIMKECIPV